MTRRRSRIPGSTSPPRTVYLLPGIPDDAPEELKNRVALRNVASMAGICEACGAVGKLRSADVEHELVYDYVFLHQPSCPVLLDAEVA